MFRSYCRNQYHVADSLNTWLSNSHTLVSCDGLGIEKKERRRRIRGRRAVECPGAVSKPRNRDERNRAITSEPQI